jgi:hypothetical protein
MLLLVRNGCAEADHLRLQAVVEYGVLVQIVRVMDEAT